MYNLAVAALKREGMATALPGFRKAGELDPSQDDFFFSLAGIYDDGTPAPDPDDVAHDRDSRIAAAVRARVRGGLLLRGRPHPRLVLDEHADDAEALALAGYLYLKQEAVNEAMAVALRALATNARTPTAVYVLGAAFASARASTATRVARVRRARQGRARRTRCRTCCSPSRFSRCSASVKPSRPTCAPSNSTRRACARASGSPPSCSPRASAAEAHWEIRRAAYHDTRRQGLFWQLYDEYVEGRG